MSEYQIDNCVPAPRKGVGRAPKYPFASMKVGDSFVAESSIVRNAALSFGKTHGMSFVTRKERGAAEPAAQSHLQKWTQVINEGWPSEPAAQGGEREP